MAHAFVGLPDDDELVFLYEHDGDKVRQVLWGDHLTLVPAASPDPAWTFVLWGASSGNPTRLKIKSQFIAQERPPGAEAALRTGCRAGMAAPASSPSRLGVE